LVLARPVPCVRPAATPRALAVAVLFGLAAVTGLAATPGVVLAADAAADTVLTIRTAAGAETRFEVEVVDDDESRSKGLMFRKSMADDHGMLFDFRREEPVYFWMKNTYLPLDMIFIRADGTIRSIATDATPLSEATISSKGAVRFVLEVNAGTAKRLGWKAGDTVRHVRMAQ
jgi:uncharacterized membrane protein (UPF0127 family)